MRPAMSSSGESKGCEADREVRELSTFVQQLATSLPFLRATKIRGLNRCSLLVYLFKHSRTYLRQHLSSGYDPYWF
jgi:hypothetical protein